MPVVFQTAKRIQRKIEHNVSEEWGQNGFYLVAYLCSWKWHCCRGVGYWLLYVSCYLRHFTIAVHLFVDYCLWHAALFHLGSPGPWGGEEKPTAGDLFVMTHKCMFLWQHFSKVNTIQGRGNNSTYLLEINRNTPAAATLPVKKPEPT